MKSIVTIGGGGGHARVLSSLKLLSGIQITALCPSTDSGGSTGRLKSEYRSLGYIGDLTKCIAALCPDPQITDALMHRFDTGSLAGHSVKNILLLGLERTAGPRSALSLLYRIGGIAPHRVLPITMKATELRARLRFGNEVHGETNIDLIAQNPLWHPSAHAIERVFLRPRVRATTPALSAIRRADWCIVCPGDLYSSILPVLLPLGVTQALRSTRARIIVVLNIMTKRGETDGYRAGDFVQRIERYLGRPCNFILANGRRVPSASRLAYALEYKEQLTLDGLQRDRRLRVAPLSKMGPDGKLCHDERAIGKALTRLIRH
jgi:uncharacterized cofD-like protein